MAGTGTGSPVTPSFFDSVGVLWRRKLLIILVLLVAVGATFGIDKSRTKQYQSTATLYFLAQGVNAELGRLHGTQCTAARNRRRAGSERAGPERREQDPGRARTACFGLPCRHHADSGLDRPVHRPGVRGPSGERICDGVHLANA